MNINDAFPSNYLKAADLKGKVITVTMANVAHEKLGDDDKLILYFDGKEKGLVLNKTNANNIAAIYGPETDSWRGQRVALATAWVDFQGRSVEAIRVRPPTQNSVNAPVDQTSADTSYDRGDPRSQGGSAANYDDEIPF